MNLDLQMKISKDEKMKALLKENSYWYKMLNRDSIYYKDFINEMKDKYHLRLTDKLNNVIDDIDIISTVLDTLE